MDAGWLGHERVRLTHHRVVLADGHRVGVSVGGRGVPLVLLHGIGLHRRAYLRVLNRLPQLGFLVVAIDAPGHGDTATMRKGVDTFEQRVDVTMRAIDELGIEQAVLLGHSMGGRTAAELAALDPSRAVAAVLVDAAIGSGFDESRARIASPLQTGQALVTACYDSIAGPEGLTSLHRAKFVWALTALARSALRHPFDLAAAATAVATANDSSIALRALKRAGVPVVVIHGERDLIVPLASARDAALQSMATFVTVPHAFHSWMLANPWSFVGLIGDLVETELGEAMASACAARGVDLHDPLDEVQRAFLRPDAPVLDLIAPTEAMGPSGLPRRVRQHDYTRVVPD